MGFAMQQPPNLFYIIGKFDRLWISPSGLPSCLYFLRYPVHGGGFHTPHHFCFFVAGAYSDSEKFLLGTVFASPLKSRRGRRSFNRHFNEHLMGTLVSLCSFCLVRLVVLVLLLMFEGAEASTFTFVNKCGETIWPGILSNAGSPALESTGFELPAASSRAFQAPTRWSGRFWARTGCSAAAFGGAWSCATGDCGSGQVECNGAGAAPPATLAEFTLASSSAQQDFYDVSLVDGYNLPMVVEASGPPSAGGSCAATGCVADLNRMCPAELRVAEGEACRSACEAFGTPEFCCSGAYASPATCRPSTYSRMFKSACPKSYSYAFDDPTSTFTCAGGADYTITFCSGSAPSQKSSRDSSTSSTTTASSTYSGTGGGLTLEDDSWLASLATGDATTARGPVPVSYSFIAAMTLACTLLQ